MKKLFFGICAAAAIFMVGCSKDASNGEVPASNAIEFSTYLGRDVQKRSVILGNSNLSNFGVFASYTQQAAWTTNDGFNFMFNQLVEKVGGVWNYSPKKYWPTKKGEKISFWAYAPYKSGKAISVLSVKGDKGVPVIKYTISNITEAEDFTAATLMNQVKTAPSTGSDPVVYTDPDGSTRTVEFSLKHELTRVNIQAKLDKAVAGETTVNIKSISFLGDDLATSGTYTFSDANTERGTWELGTKEAIVVDPLMAKETPSLGGYVTPGIPLSNTTAVPVFTTGEYLFLIPPGGETGTSANGKIKVKITYDIVTVDPALAAEHTVSTAVKEIDLPAGTLKQGTAYLYTLTFYTNEIVLSASVEGWGAEVGEDDNVDWNDVDR